MKQWGRQGGIVLLLLLGTVGSSWAGGLGIALDGFITQFQTFVQGLGILIGTVGLAGYVVSQLNNPFGHLLAGSINYFVTAGLFGGVLTLMPLLGLIGGGTIP
jgi:hypothetical protein